MKKAILMSMAACAILLTSCKKDKDDEEISGPRTFTVTVENNFEAKDYFNSGTTGLIMPGMDESITFNAGAGHYLSLGTMFVQSNDLFYATSANGFALYDGDGNATTGDVTGMFDLWDAGTEVNEEPGAGANQPPSQTGPNTGPDENGTVELITNISDGFTYPADEDIIEIMLSHDGGTQFTLTINNVSNGGSLESPLAPGAWAIHGMDQSPLFTEGAAASEAIERMAEDGDNAMLDENLSAMSGLVSPFAPGAYYVGTSNGLFSSGTESSGPLEALAEDGDPSGFTNVFNTPVGGSGAAPIFPGESYSFSFSAEDGDKLSFATMLVQSNDWFIAANGMNLYSGGNAVTGDVTSSLKLYDAGTEVDEYAGAGANQAPRQSGADTGADESGNAMEEVEASSNVPSISNMIKVTISAN
jgi:hypothetical protein